MQNSEPVSSLGETDHSDSVPPALLSRIPGSIAQG